MLPPVSDPSAASDEPTATDAPLPPLLPPGDRSSSHGFRTAPKCGFRLVVPNANSCRFSFPGITAPASCSLRYTVASASGTRSRRKPDPPVVAIPAVSTKSFSATGIPCSGPRSRPSRSAASASAACSRAKSPVTVMYAFSRGSVSAIRASTDSVSPAAVNEPSRSAAPASTIVNSCGCCSPAIVHAPPSKRSPNAGSVSPKSTRSRSRERARITRSTSGAISASRSSEGDSPSASASARRAVFAASVSAIAPPPNRPRV